MTQRLLDIETLRAFILFVFVIKSVSTRSFEIFIKSMPDLFNVKLTWKMRLEVVKI